MDSIINIKEMSVSDNKSEDTRNIIIKTVYGNTEIPIVIFKKFTNILNDDDSIINGLEVDISRYSMITNDAVQNLYEYMILHHENMTQENIIPDRPLVSNKNNRIFTNAIDVEFFNSFFDNLRLISELVALGYVLKCDSIRWKALAVFTVIFKKGLDIKGDNLDETPVDLISKILSPSEQK